MKPFLFFFRDSELLLALRFSVSSSSPLLILLILLLMLPLQVAAAAVKRGRAEEDIIVNKVYLHGSYEAREGGTRRRTQQQAL